MNRDYTNWAYVEQEANTPGASVKFDDLDLVFPYKKIVQSDKNLAPQSLHIPVPIATPDIPAVVEPSRWSGMAGLLGTELVQGAGKLFHAWIDGMTTWGEVTSIALSFVGGLGIMRLVGSILALTGGKKTRQRQAARWTYFSVSFIKAGPFIKYLEHAGIKIENGHQMDDKFFFGIINYRLGDFYRATKSYGIKVEKV